MKVQSVAFRFAPLLAVAWTGCVHSETSEETANQNLPITVRVDVDEVLRVVPPLAYGMHASLYDNDINHLELKEQLDDAGIALLRWPGGGYSDNYHWASHNPDADDAQREQRPPMCPWADRSRGYLAEGTDFGSIVRMLDRIARAAMITVNYGSNQDCDGPGEPKEAAAWVAYANGAPDDQTVIGEDSTGFDWKTVGFWANLRASEPLSDEEADEYNHLRIGREEPLGIEYWEVGNEVFGNGYYVNNNANYSENGDNVGFELDLHVPYDGTDRFRNQALSASTYGAGVADYIREMKAVDPSIKVGAVLVTPPDDYTWAPSWNRDVLSECGELIDFGIIHWYPRGDLLNKPDRDMEEMFDVLHEEFQEHAGDNADNIEITVTELGPPPGYGESEASVMGIFAADAYLGFIRYGATNVDWLELHNGTFLDSRSPQPGRAYYGIQFAHALAGPGDSLVLAESDRTQIRAHAGLRRDGSAAVLLINRSPFRVVDVAVEVPGAASSATVRSFASSQSRAPGNVTDPEPIEVESGSLTVTMEPETLVLIEFDAE